MIKIGNSKEACGTCCQEGIKIGKKGVKYLPNDNTFAIKTHKYAFSCLAIVDALKRKTKLKLKSKKSFLGFRNYSAFLSLIGFDSFLVPNCPSHTFGLGIQKKILTTLSTNKSSNLFLKKW